MLPKKPSAGTSGIDKMNKSNLVKRNTFSAKLGGNFANKTTGPVPFPRASVGMPGYHTLGTLPSKKRPTGKFGGSPIGLSPRPSLNVAAASKFNFDNRHKPVVKQPSQLLTIPNSKAITGKRTKFGTIFLEGVKGNAKTFGKGTPVMGSESPADSDNSANVRKLKNVKRAATRRNPSGFLSAKYSKSKTVAMGLFPRKFSKPSAVNSSDVCSSSSSDET